MRLLQLHTGDDELLDLHPNVTIVQGLDDRARETLVRAVRSLARGEAPERGLAEAHGVLFDLDPELLGLLDVEADGPDPVVRRQELPAGDAPGSDERQAAERRLASALAGRIAAESARDEARAEVEAATARLEAARRELDDARADATGRIESVEALTVALDQAIEQRRQLEEATAALAEAAADAESERARVAESTLDAREAHQHRLADRGELQGRLASAQGRLDPDAAADLDVERSALSTLDAELLAAEEAERAAEAERARRPPEAAPAARLELTHGRLDEIDTQLAALVPPEVERVEQGLRRLRDREGVELVRSQEAVDLARELDQLPVGLDGPSTGSTIDRGEVRTRLDEARVSLLEAEQAARNPELDRDLVDRLEVAHTELLAAQDRAEGRFGRVRAERQVEERRTAEQVILDELGFASYAEYVMGSSVRHVDPGKEAALRAARVELAAAEDAWQAIEAETDAELARAEQLEHRRQLLERARALLGQALPAEAVMAALRDLRVETGPALDPTAGLRQALDEVGLVLGTEELSRDDLLLVADAWLDEARAAAGRVAELREERMALLHQRDEAAAELESELATTAADGSSPADLREGRRRAALAALAAVTARHDAHLGAEEAVHQLSEALAAADDAARGIEVEGLAAERALSDATAAAEATAERLVSAQSDLAAATTAADDAERRLRQHDERTGPERVAALEEAVAAAEAALEDAAAAAADQEAALAARQRDQGEAESALAALPAGSGSPGGRSFADEIEWYLLARLAAQRSVSLGGSMPLLLDDSLPRMDPTDVARLLGRLERMADAVQVIVISDDPDVCTWADRTGPERAAIVQPISV